MLDTLLSQKIPLLIFSAGLSSKVVWQPFCLLLLPWYPLLPDMIVEVFNQKAAMHENIRVISNDMVFKDVSF